MKLLTWILGTLLFIITSTSQAKEFFEYNWNQQDPAIYKYISQHRDQVIRIGTSTYERSLQYRDFIEQQAKIYGVPKEIFVLAAIESSYNPKARSSANAVGMWQFLKGTSQDMGLTVNKDIDERQDWKKATIAAVKYIKYLADEHFMGNYELAVLAYNAGFGKVKEAIYKNQTADVWVLLKDEKTLAQESREYLPKFIVYAHYFSYLDSKSR